MEAAIALASLTALEIVLGIDNIVFIAILTGRLPEDQQPKARRIGLSLAMLMRIVLLLAIYWIIKLDQELFALAGFSFSGKDLILIGGGLFLIGKATYESHHNVQGQPAEQKTALTASFASVIVQILLIDLVFSLDSVITAVGMARSIYVMIAAVVIAVLVMLAFAGKVSRFIERFPAMKMLALSFLLLIGVTLVAEGWGGNLSINKGYIYFAMAFSLFVELLNIGASRKTQTAKT